MTTYEETQNRVVELKARINPATGEGFTHAEIAAVLGFKSAQSLHYYIRDLRQGRCPCCLRKLKTSKQTKET